MDLLPDPSGHNLVSKGLLIRSKECEFVKSVHGKVHSILNKKFLEGNKRKNFIIK